MIAIGCINNIILIYETKQFSIRSSNSGQNEKKHLNIQRQLRVMNSGILCITFTSDNEALLVGTVDGTIQRLSLV